MIKTIVTPQNNTLYLVIPNNYIGREIEVLLYAKDELDQEKTKPKKTMADFAGVLSEQDYQSLKSHTEQARKEWNRDI
jgi:cytochrome c553